MGQIVKKNLWLIILGTVALVYAYHYVVMRPCRAPIEYKIGALDPRFTVTSNQFKQDIEQAISIWGTAIGKKLFLYNPQAGLSISLVYDTRQQTTQVESILKSDIGQTKQTAASAKAAFMASQVEYTAAQQEYKTSLARFEDAQNAYTSRVAESNSTGGANPSEYAALTSEKESLLMQQAALEVKRQNVNQLAHETNALIEKYNSLVDDINLKVQTINSDGLSGTEFEEGVYISDEQGKRIEIYQFDTKVAFVRVLAHELGHAIGLEHNNNPNSIMNPVNQRNTLVVSPDDLKALRDICGL